MTKIWGLGFVLTLCLACSRPEGQPDLSGLEKLRLQHTHGGFFNLSDSLKDLNVVYFFAPECPLSENYCLTANLLAEKSGNERVLHLVVVPGDYFSREQLTTFAQRFQLALPIVRDSSWQLTRQFAARVTPEVYIFRKNGDLLYRGAIDNWVFDLGKKRQRITEHYADTVLMAALAGTPLPAGSTRAIGCFIEIPQ
jgi:hypothetical protein